MKRSLSALFLALPLLGQGEESAEISFNRDIRPILSENCFHCHGPDSAARESGLRLDTFEGAVEGGDTGPAIVPGRASESLLVEMIHSTDRTERMPPPKSNRVLTDAQKQLLERWIDSGAKYEKHWAYLPPERADADFGDSHPVDHFVREKLKGTSLEPSPEAPPEVLIRRVSLDLIGLPPTPEETAAFLTEFANGPDAAYTALVDRLLASPRFGERWARPWLDLARYADSNGFQADQLRDSWPYRDWVIDAINANLPYDRFTIEQIAGDLLPEPTLANRIATGFHRTVPCNVEAGVDPEENRVNQVVDRVNTTATVWLGLTLECAQCHDHKYDALSMEDYYSFFAFFNNTPLEVELPSGKTDVSHDFVGPFLDLPLAGGKKEEQQRLTKEIEELRKQLNSRDAGPSFEQWAKEARASLADPPRWAPLEVAGFESTGGEDHQVLEDHSVLISGNLPGTTVYTVKLESPSEPLWGFRLETLTHPELPGKGPGRGDEERPNFVLNEFEVQAAPTGSDKAAAVELFNAKADFSQDKWPVAHAIDGEPRTGWAIAPKFGKPHHATFLTRSPVSPGSVLSVELTQNYGRGRTLGRVRILGLVSPDGQEPLPEPVVRILTKEPGALTKAEKKQLRDHFNTSNPERLAMQSKLEELQKRLSKLKPDQALVMVEMNEPRETRIFDRGNYLSPGDEVGPNTPATLPGLKTTGATPDRLDLARWLVRRDNPLTARVAVNRWWSALFGRGLVATLEDFGTQCEPPTHPELLDWLAVELMDSGWNRKHVLRSMVTSDTYKQSSRISSVDREIDPDNRLYARAPRFRLNAERVRDNALAFSGLLSGKMHGPPVMPYQPPGVWRQVGRNEPKWIENRDEDRWRRGIYVVYRRAAPYPSMVNFDAPDRAACTVDRPRTNTPLQALTLMNDPAFVEMAVAFADRVLGEAGTDTERIASAFGFALARKPSQAESDRLLELLAGQRARLAADPKAAAALLDDKSIAYRPKHAHKTELAAWYYVTSTILNLDETMTRP
ncbi:hypothetical protein HAHE_24280 [Haloferula helveola]|uniref:Planctomycete cytochrome C n=1 Tax=Haloferula helveola TaxID=490095 RepID=A0ABN6H4E0_9BACT|nr:hypothetical protein HAHE_24280 [Haloferula helveola]